MAKSKTPSPPQEQRRAREDGGRAALLPPGLLNHGNTCFMNSVLQGLMATRCLRLLRAPALTDGGQRDQPRLGDHLVALLRTAWDMQDSQRRENMSPRDILAELGRKYDQYLDFRQQDAHEFLCQLLDAIRMEEMDAIRQRPNKRSRPDDAHSSFVDVLFGGKLASILVCQACKHVSHTYEDFTDLSLSIKPEDYARERKRDKLKQFAKMIGTALYVGAPQPRSSSVPATPARDAHLESPDPNDIQRRRSIDLADVDVVAQPVQPTANVAQDDPALQMPPSPSPVADPSFPETPSNTPQPVPVSDLSVPASLQEPPDDPIPSVATEKVNGKERRDKDESWAKISRRITVSVGLTKRPKNKKDTAVATPSKATDHADPLPRAAVAPPATDTADGTAPRLERESASLGLVDEKPQVHLTHVKRSVMPSQHAGNSPSTSPPSRFPMISRPSSPASLPKTSRPPRPPKLSTEEAAYLRDVLADINPPNIPKPFSFFKQSNLSSSASAFSPHVLKVNQINRIEECLRLFTSVEVLNGDNTVRCHRCWKIVNGFYKPRARESAQDPDSCSDSEDDEAGHAKSNGNRSTPDTAGPTASPPQPASPSHSTTLFHDTQISPDTQSTLTQRSTHVSSTSKQVPPALQLDDRCPVELVSPIQNGSTPVAPTQSSTPLQTAKPARVASGTIQTRTSANPAEYASRISLSAPSDQRRQHGSRSDSNTESETSEAESETLLSVYSDASSVPSSNPSSASQDHFRRPLPKPDARRALVERHPSGVPRSRQFLSRPAYKRYLIATPPLVLVVHLKRFQQLSRLPVVSFSTGFKKLDDYISFPEYLDLAPYLAPTREDYFDSKVAVMRGRARRPAPCMYRLYAVVVHIGNMLGGHYVAYTALPSPPSEPDASFSQRSADGGAPSRGWAFISDTVVRLSSLEEALKSKAYICMYERI